jgi:GNAT superfamily N-acetyltransferase
LDKLKLRILGPDEQDLLTQLRIDFIGDIKPFADTGARDEIAAATRHWVISHLETGRLLGYAGFAGGRPACCGYLLLYELPPLAAATPRQVGHVLNFFTYPEFRCRGYGRQLMGFIKNDARERGLFRLFLNATRMGEHLYRQCGFAEQPEPALILDL